MSTEQVLGEQELDGESGHRADARRGYGRYIVVALLVLTVGVAAATRDAWLPGLQRLLLYVGRSYLEAMQAGGIREGGNSEYLVVLREEAARKNALAFIATQPRMSYAGESIYPRTVRVTMKVPVTEAQKALESLPYVDFVMPNNPLLFCH